MKYYLKKIKLQPSAVKFQRMVILMKKFASPTSIIWVALHTVVGLIGFILIKVPAVNAFLGESIASGVGASLIASGMAGVALFLYIRVSDDFRVKLEVLLHSGLIRVFEGRSTRIKEQYDSRLTNCHEIDIIGFGLSQFREDYLQKFVQWSHSKNVRIMILDPEFPSRNKSYATQRDKEEQNPKEKIGSEIKMFVDAVTALPGLDRKKFQVRYMRALPSVNVFRIDNDVFWGPYLMGEQSRNTMTLIARKGGFMHEQIIEHFNRLWHDAELSFDAL